MLDFVVQNTNLFVSTVSKDKRKEYGQFFTDLSIARFMASLFDIDFSKTAISILDAGAGTGILSIALAERIINGGYKGRLSICCYETDQLVLPILEQHLFAAQELWGISYSIKKENYITSQEFSGSNFWSHEKKQELYDYVIGNPPYRKISKDSKEALNMCDVCYGAPNLYFLFWAMGIHNLKKGQELVYIIPRSWTSGLYFKKFRQFLFSQCIVTDIHLFESREKVFQRENILQETVIVKLKKSLDKPRFINITTTVSSGFDDIKRLKVPYSTIIDEALFVYLITNEKELVTLNTIKSFPSTLSKLNLKMQTGLIVDFRTKEVIRDKFEDNSFPLLYPQHIKEGKVVWPLGKQGEVIKTDKSSLLQLNGDYLMIKRFTTKEETRRLQCGVFLKQNYPQFEYISTQNKINFIRCESSCITFGLYVLFNSSLYDNYYRILNGSTQVNATEVNQMPIPSKATIEAIGREIMTQELSVANCDKILKKWIISM